MAKKSKLEDPRIKQRVIQGLAICETQKSIAKDVGISPSQISRFSSKEEIKPFIEKEQMRLVEAVPDAVENVKELVTEMKSIPKKDIKRRELCYKASVDTLKAVGIMSTPIQSQVIAKIYNDNRMVLSPFLKGIIDEHLRKLNEWPLSKGEDKGGEDKE
jgi:hypothetical protein